MRKHRKYVTQISKTEDKLDIARNEITALKAEVAALKRIAFAVGRNNPIEAHQALADAAVYLQTSSVKARVATHVYEAASAQPAAVRPEKTVSSPKAKWKKV